MPEILHLNLFREYFDAIVEAASDLGRHPTLTPTAGGARASRGWRGDGRHREDLQREPLDDQPPGGAIRLSRARTRPAVHLQQLSAYVALFIDDCDAFRIRKENTDEGYVAFDVGAEIPEGAEWRPSMTA
jgi:hypothetical protein